MAIADKVVPDCSFLAHAVLPTQQTPDAVAALEEITVNGHTLIAPIVLFSEFPSLLRKLVNQRRMSPTEGGEFFEMFLRLAIEPIAMTRAALQESWALATRLGQSDTFDSMAYVVAVDQGATLWTCDRRFANAARAAGLTSVRFFE